MLVNAVKKKQKQSCITIIITVKEMKKRRDALKKMKNTNIERKRK